MYTYLLETLMLCPDISINFRAGFLLSSTMSNPDSFYRTFRAVSDDSLLSSRFASRGRVDPSYRTVQNSKSLKSSHLIRHHHQLRKKFILILEFQRIRLIFDNSLVC